MSTLLMDAARTCKEGRSLDAITISQLAHALFDSTLSTNPKKEFLAALSAKGETASELAAFAEAILPYAVEPGFCDAWKGKPLFDCCGTGGGGLPLLNISTGIMFILAASGVPVVKHGNRGMTKKSGSADVLEALGIRIDLDPPALRECLERLGMGFVFAPRYHPAFAVIAPIRRELGSEGKRTIFNLLGPLLNPVRPPRQIIGVFQEAHLDLFDEALRARGIQPLVVYGTHADGRPVGEVSVSGFNQFRGPTAEIMRPLATSMKHQTSLDSLLVATAQESASRLVAVLSGDERGIARDLLLVNAAAALIAHGTCRTLEEAQAMSCEAIDSRRALQKIRDWQSR